MHASEPFDSPCHFRKGNVSFEIKLPMPYIENIYYKVLEVRQVQTTQVDLFQLCCCCPHTELVIVNDRSELNASVSAEKSV